MDLENKVITIKKSKNHESRAIPINDTLYRALEPLRKGNKGHPVFVHTGGNAIYDIRKCFSKAHRMAGIEDFRFHDLRHTFASRLVMAGIDIRTVQQLMGHNDIRMTMRYSHLSDAHMKDAISRIGNGIA